MSADATVTFKGDIKDLDENLRKIDKGFDKLDKDLDKLNADLEKMEFQDELKNLAIRTAAWNIVLEESITAVKSLFNNLVKLGKFSVAAARTQEDAQIRLAAALRATGKDAEFSLNQLIKLSKEQSKISKFRDQDIQTGAARLLTYSNLDSSLFADALRISQDIATVWNKDLEAAARIVGQALDQPATGLTRLKEAGVAFSKAENEMIDSLIEAGKEIEAQEYLLEKLEGRFSGFAEALGKTSSGKLKDLQNSLIDLAEVVGQILLPAIDDLVSALRLVIGESDNWESTVRQHISYIAAAYHTGVASIVGTLDFAYKAFVSFNANMKLKQAEIQNTVLGVFGEEDKTKEKLAQRVAWEAMTDLVKSGEWFEKNATLIDVYDNYHDNVFNPNRGRERPKLGNLNPLARFSDEELFPAAKKYDLGDMLRALGFKTYGLSDEEVLKMGQESKKSDRDAKLIKKMRDEDSLSFGFDNIPGFNLSDTILNSLSGFLETLRNQDIIMPEKRKGRVEGIEQIFNRIQASALSGGSEDEKDLLKQQRDLQIRQKELAIEANRSLSKIGAGIADVSNAIGGGIAGVFSN